MKTLTTTRSLLLALACAVLLPTLAHAHGERNQEPFLRMRTVHWYDVTWTKLDKDHTPVDKVAVNDMIEMRGKLHIFSDWPKHLFELTTVYFSLGANGPVFTKIETYLDDVPMLQSTHLEYGRDYEFRIVAQARTPGMHHLHPMLNVKDAGPLLGPGKFIEVTGNQSDYKFALTTLDGIAIPNLETWALKNVAMNHVYWLVLAFVWIGYWFRGGPNLVSRFSALQDDENASLATNRDRVLAAALIVVVLFSVAWGVISTNAKYPRTSALQGGRVRVFPLDEPLKTVQVRHLKGVYQVPGRSLQLKIRVTNQTDRPVRVGEFTAANLRFINRSVPEAVASVPSNYPQDLLTRNGLVVEPDSPIAPGETREVRIDATDSAWETQHLASLMGNPDSSYGGLIFFYDDQGKRSVAEVSGPAVPSFTSL